MGPDEVLLAVTTLSFDIAGLELYLPLMTGARVVIASKDEAQDGGLLMPMHEEASGHGACRRLPQPGACCSI